MSKMKQPYFKMVSVQSLHRSDAGWNMAGIGEPERRVVRTEPEVPVRPPEPVEPAKRPEREPEKVP